MYQVKEGCVSFDEVLPLRNKTPSED